jgi:DNA-binding NtrC family response regulator
MSQQPAPSFLFVDADPRLLAALRRLTRELPGTRRYAQSAEEALALIRAQVPSVLVSGYWLPDLDGLSLLEGVRARYPGVACALHTASPPGRLREDMGIALLEKLTPPEELLAILRSLGTGAE